MLHDTGPVSTSRSSVFINPVEHWTSGIEGVRTLTTLQPLSGFPTVVRAHVIVDITFPSFSVRLQLRLLRQRSRSGDGAKTRWTIELRLTFLKRRSPACSQERTSSPTARSRECRDEMEERDQWFTKKCSQDLRIKPRLCTFFFAQTTWVWCSFGFQVSSFSRYLPPSSPESGPSYGPIWVMRL